MRAVYIGIGHDYDLVISELFDSSKSLPIPQPKAVIIFLISSEFRILSSLAFSTFKDLASEAAVLPDVLLSLPSISAEPPAESPSTMKYL